MPMPSAMQIVILCMISLMQTNAVKPPGYVEPKKDADAESPRYEYGYNIAIGGGSEQGKQEQRDGIHASGRYFVQGKESTQEVQYFADDWGYHPAVEYSSVGPHSRSSATFALDHEAVQQLKNKENNQPQLQGLPETGNLDKQGSRISIGKLLKSKDQEKTNVETQLTLPQSKDSHNLQIDTKPQVPQQPQKYPEQPQQEGQPFQENQIIQLLPQQEESVQASYQGQPLTDSFSFAQQQPQAQPLTHSTPQTPFAQENFVQSDGEHNHNTAGSLQHFEQGKELGENLIFHPEQVHASDEGASLQNYQLQQQYDELSISNQINQNQGNLVVDQNQFQGETASLTYGNGLIQPQKIVELDDYLNEYTGPDGFPQYGLKINSAGNDGTSKLVESTQHLVSGQDVLDINGAITNYGESNIKINSQETNAEYKTSDVTSVSTTTPASPKESSLNDQPIVVADSFETDVSSSTAKVELNKQEKTYSTTAKAIATITSTSSPLLSTVVVTPRPVSTKFLAPITAGIRLQNSEQHGEEKQLGNEQNVRVDIQESIPYYLGKYEYSLGYGQQITANHSSTLNIDERAKENIELGKTLLYFPGQDISFDNQPIADVDNHITVQQLPRTEIKNQFSVDQEQAQGYQNQVTAEQSDHVTPASKEVTKIIHQPYPVEVPYPVVKQVQIPTTIHKVIEKPVHITKYVEKHVRVPQPFPVAKVVEKPVHIPVHVTKYIDRPYPVEVRVPYPQPYPVDRVVEKKVQVEKIVEKPVAHYIDRPYPVEKIVEKPVTKYIDRPYPVEKIVEKPVHHYIDRPYPVEKIVEKQVPHYVDRPYPVEKIVEKPVPHYVDRPYPVEVKVPVEKIVEKKVPHYVDRPYPVEKIVEKPVPQYIDRPYPVEKIVEKPVPHYVDRPYPVEVQVPVEKIVEKKVPHYVDRPYPVEKIVEKKVPHYVDRPYPVEKIVEKPVAHYIDRPYPVEVKVPVPQPYYVKPQNPYFPQMNIPVNYPDEAKYYPKEQHMQQSQPGVYFIANPYAYAPQINRYLPPRKQLIVNNEYLPQKQVDIDFPPPFHGDAYLPPDHVDLNYPAENQKGCEYHQGDSNIRQYDNIGLLPPRIDDNGQGHLMRAYRNARSHFDDSNIRMEYGFLPPMVPSLEIDDRGNPIEKSDK